MGLVLGTRTRMATSRWLHTERSGVSRAALVAAVIIVLIVSGAAVAIVVIQSSSASSASFASTASSAPNGGNQISVSSSLLPLSGVQVAVTSQDLVAADFISTDTATPLTCDVSGAASDLTLTNT